MGEQSSSLVTPMSAIILTYAGKSPSIERVGQTWLPIGSPNGPFRAAPDSTAAAASAEHAAAIINSRLESEAINPSPSQISQPGRYSRLRNLFASGTFVIFPAAASQSSLRPPSRREIEARFIISEIGRARVKSP